MYASKVYLVSSLSSSSSSPSDRTTKRTRNKDGSRRETGAGPNASLPFFFSFFSFLSVPFFFFFFCQPTSSRPREAKVPKGIPRRCSALPCFVVPSGAPFACPLSLVSQGSLPPRPSRASLHALVLPFSLLPRLYACLYVSNPPATQK